MRAPRGDSSSAHNRRRCGPCLARFEPGGRASDRGTPAAPPRFRRCHARRSRSNRRKTADGLRRARRIAPQGNAPKPAQPSISRYSRYDSTMRTQLMSKLLVRPREPDAEGCVVRVTPDSAGWRYVGFEVYRLPGGAKLERLSAASETCIVVLSGRVHLRAGDEEWRDRGLRETVFDGPPTGLYVPPRTRWSVEAAGAAEIAVCTAPANNGAELRLLDAAVIRHETRGS